MSLNHELMNGVILNSYSLVAQSSCNDIAGIVTLDSNGFGRLSHRSLISAAEPAEATTIKEFTPIPHKTTTNYVRCFTPLRSA